MITFGNMAKEFNDWRQESDIADNPSNGYKYVWEIPADCLAEWKESMAPYEDKLTEQQLQAYKSMFEVGQQLLGIYIGATALDTKVRLYQLTEYDFDFSIPDILCSIDYSVADGSPYGSTLEFPSGQTFDLPFLIRPSTFKMNSVFDGMDSQQSQEFGIISGEKFATHERDHHRLGEESIYGFINYKTGDIHLVRSNISNESKFEEYYDLLVMLAAGGGQSGGGSSGGSSGSGSGAPAIPPPDPYDYANITGTMKILGPPITTVLEINTDGDPR